MHIDQARVFEMAPRRPVPNSKSILGRKKCELSPERPEKFRNLARRSGNTALLDVSSSGLQVPNGNRILAKLEFQNAPTNSHYDRIYPYLLWCWEQAGLSPATHELIEVSSGNASPAFANVARELGYTAYCVLPNEISDNRRTISSEQGGIILLPEPSDGFGVPGAVNRQRRELVERIRAHRKDPGLKELASINHSQVSEAILPMRLLVEEVTCSVKEKIDCFVGVAGNGTTLYGIGDELKRIFSGIRIIALEPKKQSGLHQMKYPGVPILENGGAPTEIIMPGSGVRGLAFPHLAASVKLVDEIRLVESGEWVDAREEFAKRSGILLGHTSAASLMTALEYAQKVENQTIFTVFYDLLDRY